MVSWSWLSRCPLRVRLTAWYLVLLGLVLLLFSSFLYLQLRLSLFAQLDASLKLTESYARNHLDQQQNPPVFNRRTVNLLRYLKQGNYAVRLIRPDGSVWNGLGNYQNVPIWVPQAAGYDNLPATETVWRVYSQPVQAVNFGGASIGWLQIAHSLAPLQAAEARFLQQVLVSLPLVLVIAGFGGWFLANQALRPIAHITRTAQAIGAGNLTRRIDYRGTADEVGQLATTFDQMLDRIQAAFDRERRFTADVSHELRTPLTAIKGQIGVTLSQPRSPTEHADRLHRIENSVDRLVRLTDDLLFLARLDQGRLHPAMEILNLDLLLEAVVEQVKVLAEAKQIRLTTQVVMDLMALGNPDYLIRLFVNLLDNAVKYTPIGGQVTIQADYEATAVWITVQDTGPGIAAEHLPRLFDRFYRVERARDRNTGGAGLGLAIAAEIAHLHGGDLTVESKVGYGTCFTVRLPLLHDTTILKP